VAADPRRLDRVEERLDAIDRLRRKYGDSVDEILAFRAARAQELGELEGDLADSSALEADVSAALEDYARSAKALSARRREWAEDLTSTAQAQFAELALGRARLQVELGTEEASGSPLVVGGTGVRFGPEGFDRVELYLAANPGEAPRPLATSASGGELSRIYLALRLAAQRPRPERVTMVFDEADAGLGGEAASALGRKLRRLGAASQILAVTHLAQVASFAHHHFGVRKLVSRGRTETTVGLLDEGTRVDEVARMLAGDQLTDVSRSHAEELIAAATVDEKGESRRARER
jgi:DNA repair protein RecN (Recombination protein N)